MTIVFGRQVSLVGDVEVIIYLNISSVGLNKLGL